MNSKVIGTATTTAAAQKVVKYCWIISRSSQRNIPKETVYIPVSGTPERM